MILFIDLQTYKADDLLFMAKPLVTFERVHKKSNTLVLIQHRAADPEMKSASPFMRFDIIPFHLPVSSSSAPQALSNRLN